MLEKLLVLAITMLRILPLGLRRSIGSMGGSLAALIPSRERKVALLQLRRAFPNLHAPTILSAMYRHLGRTILECINLHPLLSRIDQHVTCNDWDVVNKLLEKDERFVILTAHTGNWDLTAAYGVAHNLPIRPVGRVARMNKLHSILDEIRQSYGVKTLWRNDESSGKEVLREMKHGKVVCALIDQDTFVSSVPVQFFGSPAKTPSGLVALAKRLDYRILAAFNFRVSDSHYQVFVHQLDDQKTLDEILLEYNQILEGYIRRFPEQWVWIHKRWRTQENGDRFSSREYIKYLQTHVDRCNHTNI